MLIGIDSEYTQDNPHRRIVLAVGLDINGNQEIYDLATQKNEFKNRIKELKDNTFVGHNIKTDILSVYLSAGIWLKNVRDIMLMSLLLKNDGKKIKGRHTLETMQFEYLQRRRKNKHLGKSFLSHPPGVPLVQEQKDYLRDDIRDLVPIYNILLPLIPSTPFSIDCQVLPILAASELHGVNFDIPGQKQNIKNWQRSLLELEKSADEWITSQGLKQRVRNKKEIVQTGLFGEETITSNKNVGNINYQSHLQLTHLFNYLGLPLPRGENKSGVSFAENALLLYTSSVGKNIDLVNMLIYMSKLRKRISTYGEDIIAALDSDGRMRTEYHLFASTGRISSTSYDFSGYNLNNIPKDNLVRNKFIPSPGKVFVDVDMEGQEITIAAALSNDTLLMRAANEGFDLHSYLSSKAFSIINNHTTTIKNDYSIVQILGNDYICKDVRQLCKNAIFSLFYGGGWRRIYEYLSEWVLRTSNPEQVSISIHRMLKQELPGLMRYLNNIINSAQTNGFLSLNTGRKRYFDKDVYGEAANFPVQGHAGESMKLFLIKLNKRLSEKEKIVFIIYDQVVVETSPERAQEVRDLVINCAQEALQKFVKPLKAKASGKITNQWEI